MGFRYQMMRNASTAHELPHISTPDRSADPTRAGRRPVPGLCR